MLVGLLALCSTGVAESPSDPGQGSAPPTAIEAYRQQHLALYDSEAVYWGVDLDPVWGHRSIGPDEAGMWPQLHPLRAHRVLVMRDGQAMDVPEVLHTLGDPYGAIGLRDQIRRRRADSTLFKIMAVGGIGTVVVGSVGVQAAPVLGDPAEWRRVTLGGFVLLAGGLVVAGLPGKRADRLEHDPSLSLEPQHLVREVERYNRQLAEELGIDEETAQRITAPPEEEEAAPE